MKSRWIGGNSVRLLENGEAYFPAVFDAIRGARSEVIIETFILFDDKVGQELHAALLEVAGRGVQVDLMVDGFGSAFLPPPFIEALTSAGVRMRTFDPGAAIFGQRLNVLRRMHRKIVVVDAQRAFVGGINFSADHLADYGPMAKQDYSIEVGGPIVDEIRGFALQAISDMRDDSDRQTSAAPSSRAGTAEAIFVTRDNLKHRNSIERHYRAAIRSARKRVLIANAYFFPGYRLLRSMTRAARSGVDVHLILQGEPDMPIVKSAAELLYGYLHRHGVHIHEYLPRPLHGKVAVVDDDWATVGSSNLDPLSLSLNLEANVILRDAAFASELRGRLEQLVRNDCREIVPPKVHKWLRWWQHLRTFVVFHILRRFPTWARRLPRHVPRLVVTSAVAAQPAGAGGVQSIVAGVLQTGAAADPDRGDTHVHG